MKYFLCVPAIMVVLLACTAFPPPASAAEVALGYGVPYSGGTHRGVDVALAAGADIESPVSGTVLFAGSVPADGGGTCTAVTIQTSDGLRVSLLPLSGASVSQGTAVVAGDEVGVLAGAGDDSCAVTHLHMSLRRGDAYLDPTALLPVTPQTQQAEAPVGAAAAPAPGVASASAAHAPMASQVSAPALSTVAEPAAEACADVRPETTPQLVAQQSQAIEGAGVPAPSDLRSHVALDGHRSLQLSALPTGPAPLALFVAAMSVVGVGVAVRRTAHVRA